MGEKIVLTDRDEVESTIAEEQLTFVFSVLSLCGFSEEDLLSSIPNGKEFSIDNKVAFREFCDKFKIVVLGINNNIEISFKNDGENTCMAIWYEPEVIMQVDNETKKMFANILFKWWTVFEKE